MVVKKSAKKIEADSELSHILKESQSILGAGNSILAAVEVIVDIDGELDPELEEELLATVILEPGEDLSVLEAPDYVEINDTLFSVLDEARAEYKALEDALGDAERSMLDEHSLGVAKRRVDDATNAIVEANKGLVRIYVRRFLKQTNPVNREDYEASGTLGLIKAIDSYDRDRGRFSSWAWRPIVRETLRAVRAAEYAYVNTGDFEKRPDILKAREVLRGDNLDYEPSYKEIAALAKVTTRQVERVLRAREHESLSKPIGAESDMTLGEVIEDVEVNVEEQVMYGMSLDALDHYGLQSLEPRELFVLTRRFGLDGEPEQKLSKLGQVLNLSREAVRQVEGRALAKLSHPSVLRKIAREGRI